MEDLSKRCFLCMRKKDEANRCPHCGSAELSQESGLLPLGTILGGRYYVGKAKKQNNEGATYIAYDLRDNRRCSVREFFPAPIARREADALAVTPLAGQQEVFAACRGDFEALWAKLMRLRGLTALIDVTDQFAENGTSYAAFAETEESTLRDHLLGNGLGYISWEQARILFMPVLSTLATLHTSGVLHRGLNPDSFLVTESGKLKLTDFSIADVRVCYGELDAEIAEGYAPIEVYAQKYSVGTWTDIYAFTAVLYRALIGTKPIPAPTRLQNDQMMIPAKFAEELPPYVINAIINGMQIEPETRTRNVEQLRSNLSASPRAVSASAGAYRETERAAARSAGARPEDPYAAGARRSSLYEAAAQRPRNPLVDPPADPYGRAAQQPRQSARPAAEPEPEPRRTADAERLMEEQRQKEKTRRTLLILLGVLLAVAVVGLGFLISGAGERNKTPAAETTTLKETVSTPDFVGAMYDTVVADSYYSQYFPFIKVE